MATALPFYGTLGPMQRRLGAIVLGGEVPVLVFGALGVRGVGLASDDPRAATYLWLGLGLAVVAVVAARCLRRPFGVTLGWLVQLVVLASAVLANLILLVAAIFIALYATALMQGHKMDRLTEEYLRTHPA